MITFNQSSSRQFIEKITKFNQEDWRDESSIQEVCLSIFKNIENYMVSVGIPHPVNQQGCPQKNSIQEICDFILENEANVARCVDNAYKRQLLTSLSNRITREFPDYSDASKTTLLINHYAQATFLNISDILISIFACLTDPQDSNGWKNLIYLDVLSVSKNFYKCARILTNQWNLKELVTLKFCGITSTNKIIDFIKDQHFTRINLEGIFINDDDLKLLAERCKIETLKIDCENIQSWPEMKFLKKIIPLKGTTQDFTGLSSACSNLEKIDLHISEIEDEGLKNLLQTCQKLEKINLKRSILITCENLTELTHYLNPLKFTSLNGLLTPCPNLKVVNLSDTSVTDKGLRALVGACSNLEKVNLTNTEIADGALEEIAEKCHNLQKLILKYTKVTVYGVIGLFCISKNLVKVDLRHTGIRYGDMYSVNTRKTNVVCDEDLRFD